LNRHSACSLSSNPQAISGPFYLQAFGCLGMSDELCPASVRAKPCPAVRWGLKGPVPPPEALVPAACPRQPSPAVSPVALQPQTLRGAGRNPPGINPPPTSPARTTLGMVGMDRSGGCATGETLQRSPRCVEPQAAGTKRRAEQFSYGPPARGSPPSFR